MLGQGPLRRPAGVPSRAVQKHDARTGTDRLDVHSESVQARPLFAKPCAFSLLQGLLCSRCMEPAPRSSFEPAGAGALLMGTTAASVGVGALVGWAAGSAALGALGGAVVGIPGGIFVVYRRYRGYFT